MAEYTLLRKRLFPRIPSASSCRQRRTVLGTAELKAESRLSRRAPDSGRETTAKARLLPMMPPTMIVPVIVVSMTNKYNKQLRLSDHTLSSSDMFHELFACMMNIN